VDIDNYQEYQKMAVKIVDKQSIKPVYVWFDTKDVNGALVGFFLHGLNLETDLSIYDRRREETSVIMTRMKQRRMRNRTERMMTTKSQKECV
jgi:hypothetical protein